MVQAEGHNQRTQPAADTIKCSLLRKLLFYLSVTMTAHEFYQQHVTDFFSDAF